jgi:hypothetical protein
VVNSRVVDRPANPAILAGLQLQNVPLPSTLRFDGQDYPISEATVDLAFDAAGSHVLQLLSFPYLDATFAVTT